MRILPRRVVLAAILALVAGASLLPVRPFAAEGAYPSRPVTMVAPVAPGGILDLTARLLAAGLGQELGREFVIENRGGASGNIGIEQVARAEPDGYTLLVTYSGYQVANPFLFRKLGWDPIRDFVPIGMAIKAPHLIVARRGLPVASLTELIEYARAHPGALHFGAPGRGWIAYIGGVQLQQLTGTKLIPVFYHGAAPAMTDLLAGNIDLLIATPPSAAGPLSQGSVHGLAVAGDKRLTILPDIPTTAEAGLPGLELEAWTAVYAPAGTPQPVVDRLAAAMEKVVDSAGFQQRAAEQGTYPVHMRPQELGAFTQAELDHWGEVIKAAGIQPE